VSLMRGTWQGTARAPRLLPTVIFLHGTSSSKSCLYCREFLARCTAHGWAAMSFDGRCFRANCHAGDKLRHLHEGLMSPAGRYLGERSGLVNGTEEWGVEWNVRIPAGYVTGCAMRPSRHKALTLAEDSGQVATRNWTRATNGSSVAARRTGQHCEQLGGVLANSRSSTTMSGSELR